MSNGQNNKRIPFFRYFPLSIKFYGLKSEKLAAFIFIAMLTINFISNLIAVELSKNLPFLNSTALVPSDIEQAFDFLIRMSIITLFSFLLSNIISSYYTYAFIRDLRGIPNTFKDSIVSVTKKLFKIIILSLIISLFIIFGTMLFIIPGLILYIMFIFSFQYMVDQNKGTFNSLKSSLNLTSGYKFGIFISVLILNLISIMVSSFFEGANGVLVLPFILAFVSTIFNIVYQRFLTLIYFDLEYIRKPNNLDIKV